MARLGTEKRPAVVRVQTEERMEEIASIFEKYGWKFIIGLEPDEPEDITDLERLLNPDAFQITAVKIGRNEPCPCGSGKKYKKCCLGKQIEPENNDSDNLDELMQKGYVLAENNQSGEACKNWLEVWSRLKSKFTPDMKSIEDAERIFIGQQNLFNWCQDLEAELGNAAIDDSSFHGKRLEYCNEFITLFPETSGLILHNMKRAAAESYFGIGDPAKGDEAFSKLIEEYPENIWGYIGWGDMYLMSIYEANVPNYDKAEQIYKMALGKNLKDKDDLLERLDELERVRKTSPRR